MQDRLSIRAVRQRPFLLHAQSWLAALAVGVVTAPSPGSGPASRPAQLASASAELPLPPAAIVRLGTRRFRHNGPVRLARFSPDGRTIVSWARDAGGLVHIWETATGKPVRTLAGRSPNQNAMAVALSPDGKLLAEQKHRTVRIWRVSDGQLQQTLQERHGTVLGLAFSPDGSELVSGSLGGVVTFWDLRTGKRARVFAEPEFQGVSCVAWSRDGASVAWGTEAGKVRLCSAETHKITSTLSLPPEERGVCAVALSPDGTLLAAGGKRRAIVWSSKSGRPVLKLPEHRAAVSFVKFAEAGRWLVTGSAENECASGNELIHVWDTKTGRELKRASGCVADVLSRRAGDALALTVCGHSLGWISLKPKGRGGFVCPEAHTHEVSALVFSPDGRLLASGGALIPEPGERGVRIWDIRSGKQILEITGQRAVTGMAFAPRGDLLATVGYWDRDVKLWQLPAGKLVRSLVSGRSCGRYGVAFSPDGRSVASSVPNDPGAVEIWNLRTGNSVVAKLSRKCGSYCTLSYSRSGQLHVASPFERLLPDVDDVIYIWRPPSRKVRAELRTKFRTPLRMAFSPDARHLATGWGDGRITIWDTGTAKRVAQFRQGTQQVCRLAYAPDGKFLVSGAPTGEVSVWIPRLGQLVKKLHGHAGRVGALAFSPDGSYLGSGSADTTVVVWDWKKLVGDLRRDADPAE